MARGSNNSFLIGFIIGFFGGCAGVLVALLLDRDWVMPAVMGMFAATGLSLLLVIPLMGVGLMGEVASNGGAFGGGIPTVNPDGTPIRGDTNWGLIIAVITGGVIAAAGAVGAGILYFQDGGDGAGDSVQSRLGGAPRGPVKPPDPPPFDPEGGTGGQDDGPSYVSFDR